MCGCICMRVCVCRPEVGDFLICSPLYVRIQGLSWNLSLMIPFSYSASQLSQGFQGTQDVSTSWVLRLQVVSRAAWLLSGCWDLSFSPHVCVAHTLSSTPLCFGKIRTCGEEARVKPRAVCTPGARPTTSYSPSHWLMLPNVSLMFLVHRLERRPLFNCQIFWALKDIVILLISWWISLWPKTIPCVNVPNLLGSTLAMNTAHICRWQYPIFKRLDLPGSVQDVSLLSFSYQCACVMCVCGCTCHSHMWRTLWSWFSPSVSVWVLWFNSGCQACWSTSQTRVSAFWHVGAPEPCSILLVTMTAPWIFKTSVRSSVRGLIPQKTLLGWQRRRDVSGHPSP